MNEEFLNNLLLSINDYYLLFDREKCNSREFVIESIREFIFLLIDIDFYAEKEQQRNLFTINKPKEAAYIQYYNEKLNSLVRSLIGQFNRHIERFYNIDYKNKTIETYENLKSLNNDLVFNQIIEKENRSLNDAPSINDIQDIWFREPYSQNLILIEQAKNLIISIEQKFPLNVSLKSNDLTHRLEAIIYKYKAEAKYITTLLTRTEIRQQFGKGREKAVDSVNENSKAYKKITADELRAVIPHLIDFPNAQKAAINDLDKLN